MITDLAQRELARQTHESIEEYCNILRQNGEPQLRTLLCIGGTNLAEQGHIMSQGPHMVVATPGRLIDMLEKRKLQMSFCK